MNFFSIEGGFVLSSLKEIVKVWGWWGQANLNLQYKVGLACIKPKFDLGHPGQPHVPGPQYLNQTNIDDMAILGSKRILSKQNLLSIATLFICVWNKVYNINCGHSTQSQASIYWYLVESLLEVVNQKTERTAGSTSVLFSYVKNATKGMINKNSGKFNYPRSLSKR